MVLRQEPEGNKVGLVGPFLHRSTLEHLSAPSLLCPFSFIFLVPASWFQPLSLTFLRTAHNFSSLYDLWLWIWSQHLTIFLEVLIISCLFLCAKTAIRIRTGQQASINTPNAFLEDPWVQLLPHHFKWCAWTRSKVYTLLLNQSRFSTQKTPIYIPNHFC